MNSALVTGAGPVRFTGPGQLVVGDREQQRADLVLEADPRHVLAAVAKPGAQAQREQRLEPAQHPAARRQHQAGAHQHHPRARMLRGRRRGLPVLAELGQETATGGAVSSTMRSRVSP